MSLADSEEKHEPVSDIDIALVDSLKALDPKPPIREADVIASVAQVSSGPETDMSIYREFSYNL